MRREVTASHRAARSRVLGLVTPASQLSSNINRICHLPPHIPAHRDWVLSSHKFTTQTQSQPTSEHPFVGFLSFLCEQSPSLACICITVKSFEVKSDLKGMSVRHFRDRRRMSSYEYWLISAPGDKTCQQTFDKLNQVSCHLSLLSIVRSVFRPPTNNSSPQTGSSQSQI